MNQLKEFLSRALLFVALPAIAGVSIFYLLSGNHEPLDIEDYFDLTDDDIDPRNK
jgi:hypothetical protein